MGSKMYLCDLCEYKSNIARRVEHHKLMKHDNLKFGCDQCSFASGPDVLSRHVKSLHGSKDLFCNQCDFKSNRKSEMKWHMLSPHQIGSDRNNGFPESYYPDDLKLMIETEEVSIKPEGNIVENQLALYRKIKHNLNYFCQFCDFAAAFRNSLNLHIDTCHEYEADTTIEYKCNECDFQTLAKESLTAHKCFRTIKFASSESNNEERNEVQLFEIDKAERYDSVPLAVQKAIDIQFVDVKNSGIKDEIKHFGKTEVDITECFNGFSEGSIPVKNEEMERDISVLEVEIKANDPISSNISLTLPKSSLFECKKCDFHSTEKGSLTNHMKKDNCYKFNCELCAFKTSHNENFRIHILEGHYEKQLSKVPGQSKNMYKCKQCDYISTKMSCLLNHLNSSEGCFKHKCLECDFKTSFKKRIRQHQRASHTMHSSSNKKDRFQCENCDYITTTVTDFKKHKHSPFGCNKYMCNYCDFKTSVKKKLFSHKRVEHVQKQRISKCEIGYKCDQCDFQTGDLKSRNNHTLSGCFKYCCISCSYKTSMFKDYQFHNKNVHIIKDCSSCDYSTTKIKYLSKHKSVGCYRHVCNLCEYKTSLHKNLMKHNKLYHAQEIRMQYTCDKCDFKSCEKKALKEHTVGECYIYKCEFCNFKTAVKKKYFTHRKYEHPKENDVDYKCTKDSNCDYVTMDKRLIRKHMKETNRCLKCSCSDCGFRTSLKKKMWIHDCTGLKKNRKYNCDECDFGSHSTVNLRMHIESKHEGVIHRCKDCDYKTQNERELTRHRKTIHEKYKCEFCNFDTIKYYELMEHVNANHLDYFLLGNEFLCRLCDYRATTRNTVRLHVKVKHRGVRHQCDLCDSSFVRSHLLIRHKQVKHEALSTIFSCTLCDYKSTRKDAVTRHTRAMHEGKRYNCTICAYKAYDMGALKRHLKTKHKTYLVYTVNGGLNPREPKTGQFVPTTAPGVHQNSMVKIEQGQTLETNHLSGIIVQTCK